MAETAQEYIRRITDYAKDSDPLDVLASTPSRLGALVSGADETRLTARPSPDKWSAQEIVAHLADVELVMGYRVRKILQTDGVEIQAFDQDAWANNGQYQRIPARRSVERLRALREANVELAQSFDSRQLSRHGLHAERGKETIEQILRLWAGHDINHIRQLERILK